MHPVWPSPTARGARCWGSARSRWRSTATRTATPRTSSPAPSPRRPARTVPASPRPGRSRGAVCADATEPASTWSAASSTPPSAPGSSAGTACRIRRPTCSGAVASSSTPRSSTRGSRPSTSTRWPCGVPSPGSSGTGPGWPAAVVAAPDGTVAAELLARTSDVDRHRRPRARPHRRAPGARLVGAGPRRRRAARDVVGARLHRHRRRGAGPTRRPSPADRRCRACSATCDAGRCSASTGARCGCPAVGCSRRRRALASLRRRIDPTSRRTSCSAPGRTRASAGPRSPRCPASSSGRSAGARPGGSGAPGVGWRRTSGPPASRTGPSPDVSRSRSCGELRQDDGARRCGMTASGRSSASQ